MYKIEANIKMPKKPQGTGAKTKYPFKGLEVGDSFFVPKAVALNMSGRAHYWGKKLERKYSVRTVTEGGVKGVRAKRTE